ncbi:MAG TPA: flavodoxin domain-containing protein [Gemmatimonadaceae bacterium]|nr:flavodoxin domain-containing protein [Gemmatimonadaceae bacterium]
MSAPRILIVYGTTHGQTARIAGRLQQILEQDDFQVTVSNVKEEPVLSLNGFHGVIVGASVIARGHQPAVAAFIRAHRATLNAMPSAFFSVSASAGSASEGGRAAARRVRDAFLAETGFSPAISECVAGAIRYTRYNLLLKWYMKRASRKNGGSTDTSRDHEYTDWEQVRNFALAFADLFRLRAQVADMARGHRRETTSPPGFSLRGAEHSFRGHS